MTRFTALTLTALISAILMYSIFESESLLIILLLAGTPYAFGLLIFLMVGIYVFLQEDF